MARSPFQILVFPFRRVPEGLLYGIFRRRDGEYWQGIAGGGEDDETPLQTARREACEEAGISSEASAVPLSTIASVPALHFREHEGWGADVYVVTEYSFGIEVGEADLQISSEHTDYRWLSYEDAYALLRYDSNRTALWELHCRLLGTMVALPS